MKLICTKGMTPWFKAGAVHDAVTNKHGNLEVLDSDEPAMSLWWYLEATESGYAVKLPNGLTLAEFKEATND